MPLPLTFSSELDREEENPDPNPDPDPDADPDPDTLFGGVTAGLGTGDETDRACICAPSDDDEDDGCFNDDVNTVASEFEEALYDAKYADAAEGAEAEA